MTGQLLSEAEIASWLRPNEALELLPPDWDLTRKRRLILRRLASGDIKAYAAKAEFWDRGGRKRQRLVAIAQHLWSPPWQVYDHDFWAAGDVSFDDDKPPQLFYVVRTDELHDEPEGPTRGADFTGVRFDPASFRQAFDLPDPEASTSPNATVETVEAALVPTEKKGGRPAGHHGEPIAAITKRLLSLTSEERQAYKAHVLTGELIQEYGNWGATAPSNENAAKIAAGILKIVRN